mgnify:CR=1 FL=1
MCEPDPMPFRIVRSPFLGCALFAGLLASAPVFAQEYPARDVGGWTVAASKDGRGCFLTRTYEGQGGTTLLLGLDVEDSNHLSVLNENWSIKPKDRWKLTFRLSNGGYSDHPVIGMASDGKKGFVTNFDAKFPSHFAGSRALHIYRGKVPVEQLDLSGSGAAAPAGVYGASPLISAPLGGVSGPVIGATLGGPYGQRSGSRLGLIIAAIVVAAGMIGGATGTPSGKRTGPGTPGGDWMRRYCE